MTILIVDDDPDIRELLVETFSADGWDTTTAANGKEALEYLGMTPQPPRLILLDLMMPVMNGAQCWLALKSHGDWSAIPVMLLSAGIYLQRAAGVLPVAATIPKPIDMPRLLTLARPYRRQGDARAVGQGR